MLAPKWTIHHVGLVVVCLAFLLTGLHSSAVLGSDNDNILCQVSMIWETDDFQKLGHRRFICEAIFPPTDDSSKEETTLPPPPPPPPPPPAAAVVLFNPSYDIVRANTKALRNDEWYITFPSNWLSTNFPTPTIREPSHEAVATVDLITVDRYLQSGPSGLRNNNNVPARKRTQTRQTRETKPEESVLVVLVAASDVPAYVDADEANRVVFGSGESGQVSAASQFLACSFGEFEIVPFGEGVIEVVVDGNISQYDRYNIRQDGAQPKVCEYFEQPSSCNPATTEGIDHIIYVLPFGLSSDNELAPVGFGTGAVGGTHVLLQGPAFTPATILHEFGHNFLLGHAGEGTSEYGDSSGQMGSSLYGSSISADRRCFNGWNMWEMGWLKDRRYEVDPADPVKLKLATFVDYDLTQPSEHVNIRVGDYYITYNVEKGMNLDTTEHKNKAIVVQMVPDENVVGYFDTDLVAALDTANPRFTVDNLDGGSEQLVIQVCDMVSGPPDYVTLAVGLDADCDLTNAPTAMPTLSPIALPTPAASLAPTVPTTSDKAVDAVPRTSENGPGQCVGNNDECTLDGQCCSENCRVTNGVGKCEERKSTDGLNSVVLGTLIPILFLITLCILFVFCARKARRSRGTKSEQKAEGAEALKKDMSPSSGTGSTSFASASCFLASFIASDSVSFSEESDQSDNQELRVLAVAEQQQINISFSEESGQSENQELRVLAIAKQQQINISFSEESGQSENQELRVLAVAKQQQLDRTDYDSKPNEVVLLDARHETRAGDIESQHAADQSLVQADAGRVCRMEPLAAGAVYMSENEAAKDRWDSTLTGLSSNERYSARLEDVDPDFPTADTGKLESGSMEQRNVDAVESGISLKSGEADLSISGKAEDSCLVSTTPGSEFLRESMGQDTDADVANELPGFSINTAESEVDPLTTGATDLNINSDAGRDSMLVNKPIWQDGTPEVAAELENRSPADMIDTADNEAGLLLTCAADLSNSEMAADTSLAISSVGWSGSDHDLDRSNVLSAGAHEPENSTMPDSTEYKSDEGVCSIDESTDGSTVGPGGDSRIDADLAYCQSAAAESIDDQLNTGDADVETSEAPYVSDSSSARDEVSRTKPWHRSWSNRTKGSLLAVGTESQSTPGESSGADNTERCPFDEVVSSPDTMFL